MHITYERLPDFYFCRKILGHTHNDCEVWELTKETLEVEGFPYGTWLRASPPSGGNVVTQKSRPPLDGNRVAMTKDVSEVETRAAKPVKVQGPTLHTKLVIAMMREIFTRASLPRCPYKKEERAKQVRGSLLRKTSKRICMEKGDSKLANLVMEEYRV